MEIAIVTDGSMYILVTNDDGIQSAGLLALRRALDEVGETAVMAPDRNWSAAGRYRKLFDPLRAWDVILSDGSSAMTCNGTPADCVALAVMGLLPRKPDLVVSGINYGANLGNDLLYSGTVAAAMEGLAFNIPSIAVSLYGGKEKLWDFRAAAAAAARLAQSVAERGLPPGILLNVNVPPGSPEQIAGLRIARLGQRTYRDELVVRYDPRGCPYYWVGSEDPEDHAEGGTDVAAIAEGYISVTPIHLDLTGHGWIDELRGWGIEK